ncbi:MAG: ankyrin repeat domain-containing protein, partial [Elusimicrobiaceae bacterium]|nr:ankyrin repeat domain-containing protein [Elusimicrobiaceae bacterium]
PNGNTLLHLAALNGETDMVKALLAHPHIQTNVQNNQGQTPLDVAQDRRQTDVVAVFEHFYQNH